jgi:TrpR-related protein YerC/YecD
MKRRAQENGDGAGDRLDALAAVLAALESAAQVRAFLQDLCTPAELEAMTDRWRVVPLLRQGMPYREIHDLTQVSVTTIGRVARTLEHGTGGYALASPPPAAPASSKESP